VRLGIACPRELEPSARRAVYPTEVQRRSKGDSREIQRIGARVWRGIPVIAEPACDWGLSGSIPPVADAAASPKARIARLTTIVCGVRECSRLTCRMNKFNFILLKVVRWSGWPLLPLIFLFLLTGYIMDGRYGLSRLLDEKSALTFHRMLHLPLIILVLVHSIPAVYLAVQRWGWIRHREEL
jgi:hypothetical protein